MKAFKILDLDDNKKTVGYVIAEDLSASCKTLAEHCREMDTEENLLTTALEEMTREEFCAIQLVDETAEPDEDGEYPISPMDYDEEVLNVTEPYVIEFEC